MRRPGKLSQTRCLASAGSKADQGLMSLKLASTFRNEELLPLFFLLHLLSWLLQGVNVQRCLAAGSKTGEERLVYPKLSFRLSKVPGGRGSLRGLIEGSSPSSPPIPTIMGEGVDGSPYQVLLGLVWDHRLSLAKIGSFPVCGRLSFFLPAREQITSDQFVLEMVRQGYSFPFARRPPLALTSFAIPLPMLQFKWEALWE